MPKGRKRTTAPGSQPASKKSRQTHSRQLLTLLNGHPSQPNLRHTALLKDLDGRRKRITTLVPVTLDPNLTSSIELVEETELETFQHVLEDNDWVPFDEKDVGPSKSQQVQKKRKKVSFANLILDYHAHHDNFS